MASMDRKFEESSPNLAARIVARSRYVEQHRSLLAALGNIFASVGLPAPAFVMPAAFAIGLFLSVGTAGLTAAPAAETTEDFVDYILVMPAQAGI